MGVFSFFKFYKWYQIAQGVSYNDSGDTEAKSKNIAQKMWLTASDWTLLMTGEKSSK